MNIRKLVAVAFGLSCLSQAHARYGQGGWFFGGVGAGAVMVNSSEPSDVNPGFTESDKTGYSIQLKGGLSWYVAPIFVVDFMAGYVHSDVSGDAPAAGQESVTITHGLGLFEISPRFRFGDLGRWQIGPLYKMHFGTDTNFREREGQSSGDEPMTHFLGLHLNYDIPSETERMIYRIGVEGVTDVSDNRNIYMVNVLFELGFNLWDGEFTDTASKDYEDVEINDAPIVEEDLPPEDAEVLPPQEAAPVDEEYTDPNAVFAEAKGNAVLVRFPGDRFQFATGMSHIGSEPTRQYIRELGEFMARNDGTWEKVSIVGHTDRRGPKGRERSVNMELSEARAQTVYNALVAAGMNASKMHYEGRAFDEPVQGAGDNQAGWRLNRRVELTFEGVRAPESILEQINQLNSKYGYGRVIQSIKN